MNSSSQDILRLLRNQCTPEEASAILDQLENDPSVFEQFTEAEWKAFQLDVRLHPVITNRMLSTIRQQLQPAITPAVAEAPVRRFRWSRMAVAAAVTIAVAGTALFFLLDKTGQDPVLAVQSETIAQPVAASLMTAVNNSNKVRPITLPDGSRVELAPNSELRYSPRLDTARRDVFLKGKALFTVAPNTRQPFTVFAGPVATTALGTVFRVTDQAADQHILVQLLSGKVVVRDTSSKTSSAPVFLLPGEALDCHYAKAIQLVKQPARKAAVVAAAPAVSQQGPILSFTETALPQVFDQLVKRYGVRISYPVNKLAHISFSGQFDSRTTTVGEMLTAIAALNDLTLEHREDAWFINLP
ncbi:MAG: FecR family protein [Candidatus Pseudobacter hemicellulosilyticus]|uniref:FecR family protein n=1 Tax=Candidatus Pseudobacter hemicellulosilyticus TaxID=3121375 RepID=A0AAJ5WPD0_9BACT|nr:MAG: FecR family protein [Pseudobacter sp.]